MLSIACVRKMQRYRVSNDMIKLNKLKEWVDNHWSRLNSTGSTPPPIEKRFVPSGGIKERLLFTLKLFCILLLLLIVMRFSMK